MNHAVSIFPCAVPNSGLYFTLNGTVYHPGDTLLITDIGQSTSQPADPGSSLVCVTENVNTQCCRMSDGGNVGEWHFPNGSTVPRKIDASADFTRSGYTHQVRLNRRSAMSPAGAYECRVPHPEPENMIIRAQIRIGQFS